LTDFGSSGSQQAISSKRGSTMWLPSRTSDWDRQARAPRKPRRKSPQIEPLEGRLVLSWSSVPPATIAVPPAGAVAISLNDLNDAGETPSNPGGEVDFFRFTATSTGGYRFEALTPSSNLDTVIGIYDAAGRRLGYNDDIAYPGNTDSRSTVSLQ